MALQAGELVDFALEQCYAREEGGRTARTAGGGWAQGTFAERSSTRTRKARCNLEMRAAVLVLALVTGALAKSLEPEAQEVPPGYPPLRGEDILRHLYKLDPAVAEEFKRQKADLDAEYTTVRQMAAKLAAERKRIRAEYPAPRDPIVGDEEQQPRSDIPANHTVSVGETLLTVSRKYGLTVEEVYVPNMDRIDASGLQPNTVLQLPAQRNRVKMVPSTSLQACQNALQDQSAKVQLCRKDLSVTSKERDEYREVSEATNAAKEDDAKAEASVEKMQKMIAELKAAKNCA